MTSTALADFVATLALAAAKFPDKADDRPSAKTVVYALLQTEKAAKQQRLTYPLQSLLGCWQLCFTAPRQAHLRGDMALGQGFYLPQIAPAQICFQTQSAATGQSPGQARISNQIQFGPLLIKLIGPAHYLGKKNLLAFNFTHLQLSLFSRAIYSGKFGASKVTPMNFQDQSLAKLPFFAFFLVTEDLIAARGRGGGLALWVKQI